MMLQSARLAVLVLGDRLVAAAIRGRRVETFVVDAENPAAALQAELDQRRLAVRGVALGLPRTSVTVKPIELPAVESEVRRMVGFELERHLPFPSDDVTFEFTLLAGGPEVVIAAADSRVVEGALSAAE